MADLDIGILYWLQDHMVCSALTPLMKGFTCLGNYGLIWMLTSVILLIPRSTRRIGIAAALSLAMVSILNNLILKPIVARPRPFIVAELQLLIAAPGGWSFPSGHTASSFATATAIFFHHKKAGAVALIVALFIAVSRLYFFVHYPTDVLGGMIEGIVIAFLVCKAVDHAMKNSGITSGRL